MCLDDEHPFRSLDRAPASAVHVSGICPPVVEREPSADRSSRSSRTFTGTTSLTLGLLNELVVGAQDARLLLVVNYPPDYRDEWRNRPNYLQLHLDPLASESLAELLQAVLGSDPSLPA